MPEPLLQLSDATVVLDGRTILSRVSLQVGPGDRLALVGPNGSGKTTLLRVLSGELPAGQLILDGQPLARWSPAALARRRALLEQQPSCAWDLSARDLARLGGPEGDAFLAQLGLAHLADQPVARLSGGERRLAHLARCLAQLGPPERKLLLLDEPDAGLDPSRLALLANLLLRFAQQGGAVILSSHSSLSRGLPTLSLPTSPDPVL